MSSVRSLLTYQVGFSEDIELNCISFPGTNTPAYMFRALMMNNKSIFSTATLMACTINM
jgi:hypothetical protein